MQWWCFAQGTTWTWSWRPYPGVWLFVLALMAMFGAIDARRAAPGVRASGRRELPAAAGLVVLWLALDWPLGPLAGGYLASAHALQFLLIAMVGVPLLLLAARPGIAARTAGRGARFAWLVHPIVAGVAFNVVVVATHVPAVVDRAMVSPAGAFALDLAWFASAMLFWWPVLVRVPGRPGFGVPLRMLYLFVGTLFHSGIAMVMLLSEYPMYRVYEMAPPMSVLTSIQDQQLAGGIMELGGAGLIIGYVSVLFFRWASDKPPADPVDG